MRRVKEDWEAGGGRTGGGRGQTVYTLFGPVDPKGRKIIAVKKRHSK